MKADSENNSLYLECNTGISGDMAVAALLDAGADKEGLLKVIESIKIKGFNVEIKNVLKNGICCLDFNVILDKEHENHDHDMQYLYGHLNDNKMYEHHHEESVEHHHEESVEHHHEHNCENNEHSGEHHEHHHEHRSLNDIIKIIEECALNENAKDLAVKIFSIIAQAEAKAHNKSINEVHFHEVGAVDSIVDIISLAYCFDNLNIKKVYVPFVNEGKGTVRCAHGILSIPVPAVCNIASEYNIPLSVTNVNGELVTPTGAAFIAAVKTDTELPEKFIIRGTGLGAGKREYSVPSVLRAFIIKEVNENEKDTIYKLESNIDDATGEALGFTMELLMEKGALDVHYVPCFMKKNRPGYILNVICSKKDLEKMEEIIFTHTTTIGIRRVLMERTKLVREVIRVNSEYGIGKVKVVKYNGVKKYYPEYESVRMICKHRNVPFDKVYYELVKKAEDTEIL